MSDHEFRGKVLDLLLISPTPSYFFRNPPERCGNDHITTPCDEPPEFVVDWTTRRERCNWVRHYACAFHAVESELPMVRDAWEDVFFRVGRIVAPYASAEVDTAIETWLFQLGRYVAWARDGYPVDCGHVARQRAWEAA